MPQVKTLQTIPSSSRLIDVIVMSVHMEFEEEYFEAWAEIKEHKYDLRPNIYPQWFREDMDLGWDEEPRKGRVRLSVDAINELGRTMNSRFLVEESHIQWE